MCLKSQNAPTAFVGALAFVKATRRLFFVSLLTHAFSVCACVKPSAFRAGIKSARVSHYLPHLYPTRSQAYPSAVL